MSPLVETAARYAGVWTDLVKVYGPEDAKKFLVSRQIHLNGATPMALMFSGQGKAVQDLVAKIVERTV